MYAMAIRASNDIKNFGGVLFDVWHKPQIKPKKLTFADTKKFMETGEYFGQKFSVGGQKNVGNKLYIMVDEQEAEFEYGKKEGTIAIRETPEMFGMRLLTDISEHPEKHFARKEMAVTDKDLVEFQQELYHIYQTARSMDKINSWYRNDQSCESKFRCSYTSICYENIKIDKNNLPNGFKLRENKND